MKLLFAIKRLNDAAGGAERVLCSLCTELTKRGHEVVVVSFDDPDGKPFYGIDSQVRLIYMGIGNSNRPSQTIETIKRIILLRKLLVKEKPQVAIGFMHSMYVPLAIASVGTLIPIVGSEHIVIEHYFPRPLQFILLIISSFLLKKITTLSESIRDRYPYLIRKRMVVIQNPVELAVGKADHMATKEYFVILNVGRLDPQKDQITLIRAFSKIAFSNPRWNLRIIGDGPLRDDLISLVSSLGLSERIAIPGLSSNICEEYSSADLFVISSRYESFGLVTAEAMSYELPSVGFSDCPGTNELIKDGITGFLVDSAHDRSENLARKIEILIANPTLREAMGRSGRIEISSKYSIETVASLWEGLLKRSCINL